MSWGMRMLAAAVMTAGALGSATSCVGLFELDGYSGVAPELCDLLRTCYGDDFYADCLSRVTERLRGADEGTRAAYLQSFADDRCLESCTAARRCLDAPPLCDGHAGACDQDEQCCGFLVGQSACGAQGCCASDGVACVQNDACCNGSCDGGVCGGVACLPPGTACGEDFECCTDICLGGRCSENTCLPDGSECTDSAECCNGFCDGAFCREPDCKPEGLPCADPQECCGGACVRDEESELGGVCSFGDCLPTNALCDPDGFPCCSGRCDPNFARCSETCGGVGESCGNRPCCAGSCLSGFCECLPDSSPCNDGKDCCSGACSSNFTCEGNTACNVGGTPCNSPDECCSNQCEQQQCCSPAQCHDVCVTGPSLNQACAGDGAPETCIEEVCAALPKCCCTAWDQDCINQYQAQQCGVCPVQPPN